VSMSDVPPAKDCFAFMMGNRTAVCPPDDPWYTAVIYEAWLEDVDSSEPLFRVSYFGQVVRAGTADENFEARKREHETGSIRDPKDLGLHAVIGAHGAHKIEWDVLSSKSGRRSEVSVWANAEEIRLIDEHGGVLRNMDTKLKQTLNLTKGGQGDPVAWWAGIEASRNHALNRFKAAMEKYVDAYGSALVPQAYVDDNKYRLGKRLTGFRQGHLWKGMSDEASIVAWAQALPKWAWNALETDEFREEKAQRNRDMWKTRGPRVFRTFKASMEAYVEVHKSALVPRNYVDDNGYKLGERLAQFRRGQMRKGVSDEADTKAWAEALPKWHWDARESDKYREGISQRGKDTWKNASVEKKVAWSKAKSDGAKRHDVHAKSVKRGTDMWKNASEEWKNNHAAKRKKTMDTEKSKAKRCKSAKKRQDADRRAELERARPIAVPFVKSQKRRIEMRAASTDFSGKHGNTVLYMISEDGATIRRVQKNGVIGPGEHHQVGFVVDPPVAEAAGPSDLNAAYVSDSESD